MLPASRGRVRAASLRIGLPACFCFEHLHDGVLVVVNQFRGSKSAALVSTMCSASLSMSADTFMSGMSAKYSSSFRTSYGYRSVMPSKPFAQRPQG